MIISRVKNYVILQLTKLAFYGVIIINRIKIMS